MVSQSANFGFLERHDPQLVRLGALAERYFKDDPNTALIKLRQFGELLAMMTAARFGIYGEDDERQVDFLRRLRDDAGVAREILQLFHQLRREGNEAAHEFAGDHGKALTNLKIARQLNQLPLGLCAALDVSQGNDRMEPPDPDHDGPRRYKVRGCTV